MRKVTLEIEYEQGDKVYHISKESDEGTVLGWEYNSMFTEIRYKVTFGRRAEDDVWCYSAELTDTKQF